ncbi:dipeptide ABC transporter ATP-binding protein [Haematomicrobium sanguinis]|uniref:dipeptide ABC transporter ATP-binding protein n=1 Tax=Haematomicrobium sanguinis TaxID=479106 RepID=UPI00068BF22B|nr:dipeptide ABC transporter ATP-binding protein [Haematomicrobium sanguinis]
MGNTNLESAAPTNEEAVLSVRDLNVRFNTENGVNHAVRGISLDLYPGKTLGLVGESGSGKSVTSMAIMGLLPPTADITGSITYRGRELIGQSDSAMSKLRGKSLAMVFQDPISSLTPVYTVGDQITETLKIHSPGLNKQDRVNRAVDLLRKVGIPAPEKRIKSYPHELSGGMRQRVMIAIAMANDPDVIIADEPTTALDVTIQAQVLEVLKTAQEETGAALLMITHDLGVVAGMADDITVMYGGRAVEEGDTDDIYYRPRMPYTIGLLGAVPRVDQARTDALIPIKGTPPNLIEEITGCSFAPRCPIAESQCWNTDPRLEKVDGSPEHFAACLRSSELADAKFASTIFDVPEVDLSEVELQPRDQRPKVLEVKNIVRHFPLTKGALFKTRIGTVRAVDDLTFDIREGECLSIVGESGSGKTSTLLEIMDFKKDQPGVISIDGVQSDTAKGSEVMRMRRNTQIVLQDPAEALDPRFTVNEVLSEPLNLTSMSSADKRKRVLELMKLVGLQPDHVNRFANQFSGGQRQRIGIARALAVDPKLIVLDEPVSALDVSVQAGVINLLTELKSTLGLSYLLVAHDLGVVRHISDRVAVMYIGKIVEIGNVDEVFDNPKHPYTRALLSAIPLPDPVKESQRERIILEGDLPSPLDVPKGCNFATRCPIFAILPDNKKSKCLDEVPELEEVPHKDHAYACFFPDEKVNQEMVVVGHQVLGS